MQPLHKAGGFSSHNHARASTLVSYCRTLQIKTRCVRRIATPVIHSCLLQQAPAAHAIPRVWLAYPGRTTVTAAAAAKCGSPQVPYIHSAKSSSIVRLSTITFWLEASTCGTTCLANQASRSTRPTVGLPISESTTVLPISGSLKADNSQAGQTLPAGKNKAMRTDEQCAVTVCYNTAPGLTKAHAGVPVTASVAGRVCCQSAQACNTSLQPQSPSRAADIEAGLTYAHTASGSAQRKECATKGAMRTTG